MRRIHRLTRLAVIFSLALSGCAELRYYNTAAVIDRPPKVTHEGRFLLTLKTCYFYPVRDWLTLSWLGRAVLGDPAWNLRPDGSVPAGSFYTNRQIASLSPAELIRGPCTGPPPKPPFVIKNFRHRGKRPSFLGTDQTGRTFLFKCDHADWPELATSAEIIATRIFWALGYHVPANYLVRIQTTGCGQLDGRRAVASLLVPGKVVGHWKFDWFRFRREMRALRLICAWINDVDRTAGNNIVAVHDGRATYYLLDFDSALGSWQGLPKPPWRGNRYVWDVQWQLLGLLSLGLARPAYDPAQPVISPAVGRFDANFDPRRWRSQLPNTAFDRLSPDDAHWIARKIAALSKTQLEAIVSAAKFTNPADSRYIIKTLLARRKRILKVWSPTQANSRSCAAIALPTSPGTTGMSTADSATACSASAAQPSG